MDSVFIQELKIKTHLGVPDWERLIPQTVILDIEIALPQGIDYRADDIALTIDYGQVSQRITQILQAQSFKLVERMAQVVCDCVLDEFAAPWVQVKISKPNILPNAKAVGMIMQRGQKPL